MIEALITWIIIILLIVGIRTFLKRKKKRAKAKPTIKKISEERIAEVEKMLNLSKNDNLSYFERLNKTKELYPFKGWRENFFEYEMEQYTQENCDSAKQVFDNLINELIKIGENADDKKKVQLFEKAIKYLNRLSEKEEALIETGEREELCELIDQITISSGLNPIDYADGEGIADLWREW